jgi:hypothetical protein
MRPTSTLSRAGEGATLLHLICAEYSNSNNAGGNRPQTGTEHDRASVLGNTETHFTDAPEIDLEMITDQYIMPDDVGSIMHSSFADSPPLKCVSMFRFVRLVLRNPGRITNYAFNGKSSIHRIAFHMERTLRPMHHDYKSVY